MSTTDELLTALLQKSAQDRARAAERLLASLREADMDPDWEAAWLAEVDRRLGDLDTREETLSWKDAKQTLREQLAAK